MEIQVKKVEAFTITLTKPEAILLGLLVNKLCHTDVRDCLIGPYAKLGLGGITGDGEGIKLLDALQDELPQ